MRSGLFVIVRPRSQLLPPPGVFELIAASVQL
jgi:hypothetical protein